MTKIIHFQMWKYDTFGNMFVVPNMSEEIKEIGEAVMTYMRKGHGHWRIKHCLLLPSYTGRQHT